MKLSLTEHDFRSTLQRQILKERYEGTYGENLVDKLKSELHGDFEDCIMAIMDVSESANLQTGFEMVAEMRH